MTNKLAFDPNGYRRMVRMSSFKYILVEGRDDKTVFKYLVHEFFDKNHDIKIHCAEQIMFGNTIGNRERVEQISESLKGKSYSKRFVGFVDREFRGFDLENEIKDLVNEHKTIDRLIWSRGHSVENYYFDFAALRRPLRNFSVTPYFDEALDLFEKNLDNLIRLACAVGLAGWECQLLKPVRGSIDWTVLEVTSSNVVLDIDRWSKNLINKQGLNLDRVNKLLETFNKWLAKVNKSDLVTIRWACHGHMGMTFIWAFYAKCVFEACSNSNSPDPQREVASVLRADETVRFNGCANEWVQKAFHRSVEYPAEAFKLLGLFE